MSGAPGDTRRFWLTAFYAGWVAVFAWSFVAYARAPYEGRGFPDGLMKPAVFLGWQGVAGCLAVAVFGISRAWPKGSPVRGMALVPLAVAGLIAAGTAGLLWWAGAL